MYYLHEFQLFILVTAELSCYTSYVKHKKTLPCSLIKIYGIEAVQLYFRAVSRNFLAVVVISVLHVN